jgi:hypothetical protein
MLRCALHDSLSELERQTFMRNPYAKPLTSFQWLIQSICWTAVCVSLWRVLFESPLSWNQYTPAIRITGLVIYWTTYVLIWKQAVIGGHHFVDAAKAQAPKLRLMCALWLASLTVFQLVMLLLGITWSALTV